MRAKPAPMVTTFHKERLQGTSERKRSPLGSHKGWVYNIAIGDQRFHVRVYDEAPGRAIVVEPKNPRTSPVVQQIVAALLADGCSEVQLFCKAIGLYRTVNPQTLDFV